MRGDIAAGKKAADTAGSSYSKFNRIFDTCMGTRPSAILPPG
jgi:hypothetical protein